MNQFPYVRFLRRLAFAAALMGLQVLSTSSASAAEPRVVVLGFDGADAKLTEQWMDEGKLPNLAKLRDRGDVLAAALDHPVADAGLLVDLLDRPQSRAGTAIFDFLKRDTETYRPSFAAFDEGHGAVPLRRPQPARLRRAVGLARRASWSSSLVLKLFGVRAARAGGRGVVLAAAAVGAARSVGSRQTLLPKKRPLAINRQQGETFWEMLGKAGKRVRVMRMPVTFPPEPFPHGELLSGLGTPDLSGRIGKPFYFTSELFFQPQGRQRLLDRDRRADRQQGDHPDRDQGTAQQAVPRSGEPTTSRSR